MRVCYFGTYRKNYSRNQIMIEGLRLNGAQVTECQASLWSGIQDREDKASGGWLKPRFLLHIIRTYWRILGLYRQIEDYDVMVLGYPGYFDVFLARLITWFARKPLVLDTFMSIYLISVERELAKKSPLTTRLIRTAEKVACHLPDLLILDTAEYVDFFNKLHGLSQKRFKLVPTGADDRLYHPIPVERPTDNLVRVVYYGTYIPNHGTLTMIKAAHILADHHDIHFEFIGQGPDRSAVESEANQSSLPNVTFVDWIDKTEIPYRVATADVVLGAFGTTPQSLMTIQNKIFEGLAMKKPVISGDSPTIRTAMTHGEHIWLCKRQNPQSLAEAICILASDPALRQHLATQGHNLFKQGFTVKAIGCHMIKHLDSLLDNYS